MRSPSRTSFCRRTESELIPCRGTPLGDGNYTGCEYGSGDLRFLPGALDCAVCTGSGYEGVIATFIPHADFGEPECPGLLFGTQTTDQAYIGCTDCDAVVRTVQASELQATLNAMELTLDTRTERCPHCGAVNLMVGFSRMIAFICDKCARPVTRRNE